MSNSNLPSLTGYSIVNELNINSEKGHRYFVGESTSKLVDHLLFIKQEPYSENALNRYQTALALPNHDRINKPLDVIAKDNCLFVLSEFIQQIPTDEGLEIGRGLTDIFSQNIALCVEQTLSILNHLSEHGLVHYDIKPSNFLLRHSPLNGLPDIVLVDFGSSVSVGGVSHANFTLTYASPEKIMASNNVTEAEDIWSLGIMLFEIATNNRLLSGIENDKIRRLLSGNWSPPLSELEDDLLKALIGGMCNRDQSTRFTVADIQLWLLGDVATIQRGLSFSHNNYFSPPLVRNEVQVHTAKALAVYLLESDRESLAADEEFLDWLHAQASINGAGLVAELRSNGSEQELNTIILRYSYTLWPDMPLTWLGHVVSLKNIEGIASKAIAETATDSELQFLRDLILDELYCFYQQIGRDEINEIRSAVKAQWDEYNEVRQAISAAAQIDSIPQTPIEEIIKTLLNEEESSKLKTSANEWFSAKQFLQRSPWFYIFGTDNFSIPQLIALNECEQLSRNQAIIINEADDIRAVLQNQSGTSDVIYRTQERLRESLSVVSGSTIETCASPSHLQLECSPSLVEKLKEAFMPSALLRRVGVTFSPISQLFQRMMARFRSAEAAEVEEELSTAQLEIDYVPLRHRLEVFDDNQPCALLVRIRWRAPENESVNLKINKLDEFSPVSIMKLKGLPNNGNISVVLFQNSKIKIKSYRSFFSGSKTLSMKVRSGHFRSNSKLRFTADKLTPPIKQIIPNQKLSPTKAFSITPETFTNKLLEPACWLHRPSRLIKSDQKINHYVAPFLKVYMKPKENFGYTFKLVKNYIKNNRIYRFIGKEKA